MKKVIFLLSLVLILGAWLVSCGGDDEDECPDISGNYQVSKQIPSMTCQDADGNPLNLDPSTEIIASQSVLNIEQINCSLTAIEEYQGISIPYVGSVNEDDYFELEFQTPDTLPPFHIALELQEGDILEVDFNFDYILWRGSVQEDNSLFGNITYNLSGISSGGTIVDCDIDYGFQAK